MSASGPAARPRPSAGRWRSAKGRRMAAATAYRQAATTSGDIAASATFPATNPAAQPTVATERPAYARVCGVGRAAGPMLPLSIAPETSEARFDDGGNSPLAALPHARHATSVHLHDSAPAESHPAGQGDPEGHLARLLPERQDRRPRRERRGQVDAAAHHGRRRAQLRGRRGAGPGHPHRPPAAGAGARSGKERAPARRGGGGRDARAAHALRGALDEARRAARGRRDGEGARRAGAGAGRDRGRQRLGARPHARGGDGRAPPPAGRRRRGDALGRRAPARRPLPGPPPPARPALLDEPTNHLDAESVAWLERHLQEYPGTVVAITHDRYFLDNVAGWILELDRGSGIPWEGNYSSWLEQKERRLAQEEKEASARRRSLARELEWVRMSPRARQAKGKARLAHYEELLTED